MMTFEEIAALEADISARIAEAMPGVIAAIDEFTLAIESARAALATMAVSTTFMEIEYLKHHGKLPGGTSNARLRKKRRDAVVRCYLREHGAEPLSIG